MLEAGLHRRAVDVAEGEQPGDRQVRRADDRADFRPRVQRHGPDGTAFAVGHVQPLAVAGQAAGLGEGGEARLQ